MPATLAIVSHKQTPGAGQWQLAVNGLSVCEACNRRRTSGILMHTTHGTDEIKGGNVCEPCAKSIIAATAGIADPRQATLA